MATSSSAASSPIASKSREKPIASVKPDSRMSVEASSFDAASTSQEDAYLGGLTEKQRRHPSHQAEISEDSSNPETGTWYYKEETVAQHNKAWGETTCTRSQFFSSPGKSKEYGSEMGPLSPHIDGHIALRGSRLLRGQGNLWNTTWRSYERFECEFGFLENAHEYHSSISGSSRKRL